MSEYFSEPKSSGVRVKVVLDLSNYGKKADLKNARLKSNLSKINLARLKSNVNELDIDKLENVPTNLSNLKSKVG